MTKEPILYESVCSIGQKIYNYKLSIDDTIIETQQKPNIKGNYETIKSHGYCEDCMPNIYTSFGLLFDYKKIVKEEHK